MNSPAHRSVFGLVAAGALLALPLSAQNPYQRSDDSWISIDGTVAEVMVDAFELEYGNGTIMVEMDDDDRDAAAYALDHGDRVAVTGVIDDDLFETSTIEASSIYVEDLGTYFYSSAFDEMDNFVTITSPLDPSRLVLQGMVTEVSDEEFTVDTGLREVTVELDDLWYDPLDDEGYQRIRVGDRVSVTGTMDYDFLEGRELVASSVVTLAG